MTNILVAGGAGNVGSCLTRRLLENDQFNVVVVDDLSTGSLENLPPSSDRLKFIKANVNDHHDISTVMVSVAFDYVFHYAAVVGVRRTLENPISVLRDIHGIESILELATNTGVRRVFFSSSSEVYGEPVESPQREDTTPLNSRLPYAVVKNIGEAFMRACHQEHGLNYTILRLFNTYGPMQSTDFVVPRFLRAALRGDDITVYGDGDQTRTFCYIDDNIDATLAILNSEQFVNDTINIGNDAEVAVIDLAKLVIELTGSSSRIVHLPPLPEGDMRQRCPDITKMRRLLGREPISLEDGIKRLIEEFK